MSNDIEKLRELKREFIDKAIASGIQYGTCGQFSNALNKAIEALTAPVASAAPSGELPPLPAEGALGWYRSSSHPEKGDQQKYSAEQMQAYACAAIAHQPPKEALTDARIAEAAFGLPLGYDDEVIRKFARAIEAATAPNKQLVAALRDIAKLESAEEIRSIARDAVSAAGVEVKP